jgi:hypothetical protein
VATGDGASDTLVTSGGVSTSTVGRNMRILTGRGRDVVHLYDLDVAGSFLANLKAGDNEFEMSNDRLRGPWRVRSSGGNDVLILEESQCDALVRVAAGSGADTVYLSQNTHDGPVAVNLGAGPDRFFGDDSVFNADLTVDGGNGNDDLNVETVDTGNATGSAFAGPTRLRGGRGDDLVAVGVQGQPFEFGVFGGLTLFDGGPGNDLLDAGLTAGHNNGSIFLVPPVVSGFETQT